MANFNIETHYIPFVFDNSIRRVRVLLPQDYHNSDNYYPVLYLQDGQNVLFDEESYSHHAWRLQEALIQTQLENKWIVVMIDHANKRRINDYIPFQIAPPLTFDNHQYHGREGQYYADFLVNLVKPLMDKTYRTLSNRQNTAICGSSLGGLICAYTAAKYPEVFGKVGVFSLASHLVQTDFNNFILAHPLKKKTQVFIQVGTKEDESDLKMSQIMLNNTLEYYRMLMIHGLDPQQVVLQVITDAIHHESVWSKVLPNFLEFIS